MPGSDTGVAQRLDVARPIEQQIEREVARAQEPGPQRERQSPTPSLGCRRVIHRAATRSRPDAPHPARAPPLPALSLCRRCALRQGTACICNCLYLLTLGVGPRTASLFYKGTRLLSAHTRRGARV